MKRFMTKLIAFCSFLLLASQAQAKLNGYNVILVNGFQAGDLFSQPSDSEVETIRDEYWRSFWLSRSEGALDWGSQHRVEGGIAAHMFEQAKALSAAGTCNNGCVFMTHSTGDLTLRYFIENQEDWFADAGMEPLKVLAVIDYAGAGGGTELANLGVSLLQNSGALSAIQKNAFLAFFGADQLPADLGVMNDLQTSVARNTATAPNDAPRLRIVGMGWDYGGVTRPFISGTDDSVVPPHSACGSTRAEAIDSCSNSVSSDGKLESAKGPSGLRTNHFPLLMGDNANHGEVYNGNETDGTITFVNNNFTAGLNIDFQTYNEQQGGFSIQVPNWGFCGWWPCITGYSEQVIVSPDNYQFVNGSKTKSMSQAILDTLGQ